MKRASTDATIMSMKIHVVVLRYVVLLILTATKSSVIVSAQDVSLADVYNNLSIEIDPGDYMIHDPSRVVTIDDKQMIAVTGKAQEEGYNCGIETWWRELGTLNWEPGQCLFQTKPSWIEEEAPLNDGAYWAPSLDVHPITNVVTLIYSVSEMTDNGPKTCVGIATSSGSFPNQFTWSDVGEPLTCIDGSDYPEKERSVIDPSVFWGMGVDDGKLFLVTGGGCIIGTELDPATYKQINDLWFDADSSEWYELAQGPLVDGGEIEWVEASYVHPNTENGLYYLFVNWGACCSGVDSTYNIRIGRSTNPMGPYLDKDGTDMMNHGGTLLLETGTGSESHIIGPGHSAIWKDDLGVEYLSFHYYDGNREGSPWIGERKIVFQEDGWPVLGDAVTSPPMDDEDDDEDSLCFSGNMEVVVRGRGHVTMDALQVGDLVKIGDGEIYEQVYAFGHHVSQRYIEFVQLHTSLGTPPLEMTGAHLVFVDGKNNPIRADSIKVGDQLQAQDKSNAAVVQKINLVYRKGIYNPLTSSGTIQVNGITASNYISLQKIDKEYVELQGGIQIPISHHDFAHLAMTPYRLYCTTLATCKYSRNEANSDHMPVYIAKGIKLNKWKNQQHIVVQLLVPVSILMIIFAIIVMTCVAVFKIVTLFVSDWLKIPFISPTLNFFFHLRKKSNEGLSKAFIKKKKIL